jgi:hypothetical protein
MCVPWRRASNIAWRGASGAQRAAGQVVGGQQQGALRADGILQGANHGRRAAFHVAQAFQRGMDEQRVARLHAEPRQAGRQGGARHVALLPALAAGAGGAAPRFQRRVDGASGPPSIAQLQFQQVGIDAELGGPVQVSPAPVIAIDGKRTLTPPRTCAGPLVATVRRT